jgi:hypothetical protein
MVHGRVESLLGRYKLSSQRRVFSFDARLGRDRIHSRKLVGGCLGGFSIKSEVKSLMRILCLVGGVII